MTNHYKNHRESLSSIAYSVMIERGLKPDFGSEALNQLKEIEHKFHNQSSQTSAIPIALDGDIQDQPDLLWC